MPHTFNLLVVIFIFLNVFIISVIISVGFSVVIIFEVSAATSDLLNDIFQIHI